MQEAFKVLAQAKREAQARLRKYEAEGDKSRHKMPYARHAIADLERAEWWLAWCAEHDRVFKRLWSTVEEGNRHVQAVSSTEKRGRRQGSRNR